MNAGTNVDFAIRPSSNITPSQRGQIARPAPRRPAIETDQTEDIVAIEAAALLEGVRLALDCDMSAAAGMAGRLLEVLTAGVSQQTLQAHVHIKLPQWKMRKIERYIEDHLEELILVADLAKLVSLSVGYFCRVFKASVGETPHSYIMHAKIDQARTMMLTTTLGLSQIAAACGLADQSHLCRCFRKVTGTTPAAWRRNHAGEVEAAGLMERTSSTQQSPRGDVQAILSRM